MNNAFVSEWEAMKTTFRLHICGLPETEASELAMECFHLLMELEHKLSRFAEGGDVWRINQMKTGDFLHISDECHRCLLAALEGWRVTGGLFDITLGRGSGSFRVDPEKPLVSCQLARKEIDLGGIGKGFALDEIKRRMEEWGAPGGLLCAGNSSLLAFGERAWPVSLGGEIHDLQNASLSASGIGMQGNHIVHPADMGPPEHPRAWAWADAAACAEIWSTAAMLMRAEEIGKIAAGNPGVERIWIEENGRLVRIFGN